MAARNEYILPGLDGSNPLAFLAALGALRAAGANTRLSWRVDLRPVLQAPVSSFPELVDQIAIELKSAARTLSNYPAPAEVIKVNATDFCAFADAESIDPSRIPFAACFGSDAIRDATDSNLIAPTRLSLANGQGGKKLLMHFKQMVNDASDPQPVSTKRGKSVQVEDRSLSALLNEALMEWKRRSSKGFYSFRWDPLELRRAAYMAITPEDDPYQSVVGANLLAFLGLTMLPSAPGPKELRSACLFEVGNRELFAWPLWDAPLSIDETIALLICPGEDEDKFAPDWSSARGIFTRFAAERYSDPQKNAFFNSSFAI